jgi:hypothetical protein
VALGGVDRHSESVSERERARDAKELEGHCDALRCVECATLSGASARRWRGYRIDDPTEDEPPALAFYCPACAEREFGSLGRGSEYRNPHSS